MTFGSCTTSEIGIFKYVFYIFRPEYMIISGIVAFLVGFGILILIIKSIKNVCFTDIIMLMLNIEYVIYYSRFMAMQ